MTAADRRMLDRLFAENVAHTFILAMLLQNVPSIAAALRESINTFADLALDSRLTDEQLATMRAELLTLTRPQHRCQTPGRVPKSQKD